MQSMCDGIVENYRIMMHVADLFLLSCTTRIVEYMYNTYAVTFTLIHALIQVL